MTPQPMQADDREARWRAYLRPPERPTSDRFWPVNIPWDEFSPVLYVVKRIALAPPELFRSSDLAVAAVIAEMMAADASGLDVCFATQGTIAHRSKVSLGTVKRSLTRLCNGPFPLLVRTPGSVTRGYRHLCNRYTLVRDPEAVSEVPRAHQ